MFAAIDPAFGTIVAAMIAGTVAIAGKLIDNQNKRRENLSKERAEKIYKSLEDLQTSVNGVQADVDRVEAKNDSQHAEVKDTIDSMDGKLDDVRERTARLEGFWERDRVERANGHG